MKSAWEVLAEADDSIWGPRHRNTDMSMRPSMGMEPAGAARLDALVRHTAKEFVRTVELATDSHGDVHVDLKTVERMLREFLSNAVRTK